MGLTQSTNNPIMNKEIYQINRIIDDVMKTLVNHSYSSKCYEYEIINLNQLYKFNKVKLSKIENLLLIPKTDGSTKKQYCDKIAAYYKRILRFIRCIKYIYDLENNGKNSISAIISKNINTDDKSIKVLSCESYQTDLQFFQKGVNFSQLSGFDFFVKDILTDSEKELFMNQVEVILDKYDKKKLKRYVCKDLIVGVKQHSNIHKNKFVCYQGGGSDIYIKVNKENPVFNWNTCSRSKIYQTAPLKQIVTLIKESKRNYINNLDQVLNILNEMVYYNKSVNKYNLKLLSFYQLNRIEIKLKQVVIIFFMQSLADYKNILNTIKLHSSDHE
tara:strand:+ start:2314 stop:3303 length:990 start_codon:yes stop_codon:yes gene_type:complete